MCPPALCSQETSHSVRLWHRIFLLTRGCIKVSHSPITADTPDESHWQRVFASTTLKPSISSRVIPRPILT
jgi:hypothetical protein